ncbi:MAG TPA: MFS transporter [Steroidobacteraceae bacterium]
MPGRFDPASAIPAIGAIRKVTLRLIPFLVLCFVMSYLDRANVGFAAFQMNSDLGLTASQFGFGSGVFFLGYCLFEVPSNLLLARIGARRWIARIMLSWGVLAAALAFTRGPVSFALLRFFLGVAEAGFFPGIVYYLSCWYPARLRARAIAAFLVAIPLSGIIGGPVSAALLGLDGLLGTRGWQLLFIAEGLPAVLLGFAVLRYLPEKPEDAHWLSEQQRISLGTLLSAESVAGASRRSDIGKALLHPTIWLLGITLFCVNVGFYAYLIWSPQIIKTFLNASNSTVGLVSAAISVLMATAMIWNGMHSDRAGERRIHILMPALVAAMGFFAAAHLPGPAAIFALALIPMGIGSIYGPAWSVPSSLLSNAGAAAGMGLMGTVANFGGFFGPYLVGFLKDKTGGYSSSFQVLAGLLVAAGLLAWILPLESRRPREIVGSAEPPA